jgi:hypothetical protein
MNSFVYPTIINLTRLNWAPELLYTLLNQTVVPPSCIFLKLTTTQVEGHTTFSVISSAKTNAPFTNIHFIQLV